MRAKTNNLPMYFLTFRVRKYPSAIRNAKIGNASLPTFVIQCWSVKSVAHKWSSSMNTMAKTCRPNEVIPIFFFSKWSASFISLLCVMIGIQAAWQQAAPWPAFPLPTGAYQRWRYYCPKRIYPSSPAAFDPARLHNRARNPSAPLMGNVYSGSSFPNPEKSDRNIHRFYDTVVSPEPVLCKQRLQFAEQPWFSTKKPANQWLTGLVAWVNRIDTFGNSWKTGLFGVINCYQASSGQILCQNTYSFHLNYSMHKEKTQHFYFKLSFSTSLFFAGLLTLLPLPLEEFFGSTFFRVIEVFSHPTVFLVDFRNDTIG